MIFPLKKNLNAHISANRNRRMIQLGLKWLVYTRHLSASLKISNKFPHHQGLRKEVLPGGRRGGRLQINFYHRILKITMGKFFSKFSWQNISYNICTCEILWPSQTFTRKKWTEHIKIQEKEEKKNPLEWSILHSHYFHVLSSLEISAKRSKTKANP